MRMKMKKSQDKINNNNITNSHALNRKSMNYLTSPKFKDQLEMKKGILGQMQKQNKNTSSVIEV